MKTLDQWFEEYGVSHQNKTNKAIHYICVPAIFFSIIGLILSIPSKFLEKLLPFNSPLLENWASLVVILLLIFYIRLSVAMALKVLVFSVLCIILNYWIATIAPLWLVSLLIFAVAWIGQFYGHKIEGKKPSFLKDLQFLLIGPAWVLDNIFKKS
ncbi:DUF962 domain-containing protein [Ascidiimonas sp. W6]|uniref:Mpo1 family 2-hydroxy fatty acid dioxygenase n=1 Tax=Ascidiimonas meishanensis TaxID=3128903 RepID=UPI0030EED812